MSCVKYITELYFISDSFYHMIMKKAQFLIKKIGILRNFSLGDATMLPRMTLRAMEYEVGVKSDM